LKSDQKMSKKERKNWNIPVPKTLDDALEHAVTMDSHSSKSEFVRDAVRRRLEEMGFNPQVFDRENEQEA
jgi:Arc/MetJ-type ribon-helix-helix transcriptional regulator